MIARYPQWRPALPGRDGVRAPSMREVRGRHVGVRLMVGLLSTAHGLGLDFVELMSRPSREAANGLLSASGIGRRTCIGATSVSCPRCGDVAAGLRVEGVRPCPVRSSLLRDAEGAWIRGAGGRRACSRRGEGGRRRGTARRQARAARSVPGADPGPWRRRAATSALRAGAGQRRELRLPAR